MRVYSNLWGEGRCEHRYRCLLEAILDGNKEVRQWCFLLTLGKVFFAGHSTLRQSDDTHEQSRHNQIMMLRDSLGICHASD